MNKKIRNFLMHPWTIKIGGIILATIIMKFLPLEKICNTIRELFSVSWNCIQGFLNFELKVWWVLAGIAVMLSILYLIIYLIQKQSVSEENFLKYTSDTILNYRWKWIWKKAPNGVYYIDELHPICSICDTPLFYRMGMYGIGFYFCSRCNKEFHQPIPNLNEVKILIDDNIKKKLENER